eukprot:364790-Chlamydomonas_euryale.AAC.7
MLCAARCDTAALVAALHSGTSTWAALLRQAERARGERGWQGDRTCVYSQLHKRPNFTFWRCKQRRRILETAGDTRARPASPAPSRRLWQQTVGAAGMRRREAALVCKAA